MFLSSETLWLAVADSGEGLQDLELQSLCLHWVSCCPEYHELTWVGTGAQGGLWDYQHQHLFHWALPTGCGQACLQILCQSKVFTTNIAKAVRFCLFFRIKLSPSVLESSGGAEAVKWAVFIAQEKNALRIQEMSVPQVGDTPGHWFPDNSESVLFAHVCLEYSAI